MNRLNITILPITSDGLTGTVQILDPRILERDRIRQAAFFAGSDCRGHDSVTVDVISPTGRGHDADIDRHSLDAA